MADIKISELERVQSLNNGDLVEVSQEDSYAETGYSSKSAKMTDLGEKVVNGIEYTSELNTSNKKIIGAINEIASYTPVYGNTASGAIATFDTSLALPLQDCTIEINAVQEAGTPTPISPKLISGFTGANITRCGGNIWDGEWELGTYNALGNKSNWSGAIRSKNFIAVEPSKDYCILFGTTSQFLVFWYKADSTFIGYDTITESGDTVTSPATAYKATFSTWNDYGSTYNNDISINYPATTTAITWQSEAGTVYGGSLRIANGYTHLVDNGNDIDLGTLTWTKNTSFANTLFVANITGKKTNNSNCLCTHYVNGGIATGATFLNNLANNNFASNTSNGIYIRDDSKASLSADDFKTAMSGVTLKYEVATPTEYTLASVVQPSAIVGTNNIFTDTNGDTSVVYACSLKDYIDGQ